MATELWERLRSVGLQELAPTLCELGFLSLDQIRHGSDTVLSAGITRSQLDRLLGATTAAIDAHLEPAATRQDLPAIPVRKRASFEASIRAADPENRAASVRRLHEGFLASSSTGPLSSRLRTWHEWCRAWGCSPFPLDHHNITCCAASMKQGSYRSCAQYFSAVVKHQERELRQPVSDLLRGFIRDCTRSVLHGLGPEQLKDAFDVWALRPLLQVSTQQVCAWHSEELSSITDALLIASWFMLREVELSNIRRSHLYYDDHQVSLLLAVYKTDTQGSLTTRTLKCCCSVQRHLFCPYHASVRHLQRLALFETELGKQSGFMFPNSDGKAMTKAAVVEGFRRVLHAAGVPLTRPDESGKQLPRFHGHCARVSGAQWLISLHLALHLVMLLGRWSSAAIHKTPLLQLPSATSQALHGHGLPVISQGPLLQAGESAGSSGDLPPSAAAVASLSQDVGGSSTGRCCLEAGGD